MSKETDEVTFSRAFAAYRAELQAYARRFVHSRAAAEDVVQDMFVRVWNRWNDIDPTVNLRGYLFNSTRNAALNHIRDQRLRDSRALLYAGPSLVQAPAGEALLRSQEIVRAVDQVLQRMPPKRRRVIGMRLYQQRPLAEIASELGITQKMVEAHITRAIRALRDELPALLGESRGGNG